MTPTDTRQFPAALAAALALPFDYDEGDGIEFEPFPAFLSAEDTTDWLRSWTGNQELTGDDFLVFGQDGTGGYAAFWLVRPGRPVEEQPVVFLGSEGETAVVARDLAGLLWLLAEGTGPLEAALYGAEREPRPDRERTALALRYAPGRPQPGRAVVAEAALEFPDFEDQVMELCR